MSTDRAGRARPVAVCVLWLLAGASMLAGCERRAVEVKTVDKGTETVPEATSPPPSPPIEPEKAAEASGRPWKVPDGWTEDAKPRPMRVATFIAPHPDGSVEVAVTRFAGRVGGVLANINRWRGQMGLQPISESELETAITRFTSAGYEGYETRIESPSGVMLAAGVYEAASDQTWYVRATVANTAVADHLQDQLFGMARSIVRP